MKLEEIYGIGPALAKKLQIVLKGRDFMKCYKDPEIFNMLPLSTKMYLKYKPIEKIKRAALVPFMRNIEKIGAIVAGSYRRGAEYCRDVDILISRDMLANLIKAATFTSPHAEGEEIIRCFIKIGGAYMFADIFIYTDETFPYMLLYTTGSKQFNKNMRGIAKAKGYKLNQHGLYHIKTGHLIKKKITNEADIFEALGMTYVEPYQRNT